MDKLFHHIYQGFAAKKGLGFTVLFLFILGLGFLASKIQFEEDITKLIPTNSQNSEAQKVLKTMNFADKIIVNIHKQPEASVDDLTDYASQFMDSITKSSNSYIKQIQGKVADEDMLNTFNFVYDHLPLFLDKNDYKIIQNKLQKDSIEAITNNNYKTLVSPTGFIARETILKDPLGLSFIALKKLQQIGFGDEFTLHNGFLLSKDQQNVLLFITPTLGSSETSENAKFVDNLYVVSQELNTTFEGKVQSEYFGGVLIAVANAKQIKQDIQLTLGIALTVLLIVLIVFYRKLTVPFVLFVPTLFGGLLAVAILFLIRTKISAISLGIGSVLLGVTLDYSLHILTHIRSNNNPKALYHEITKPILMSSLTTALAFLCLLFLKSQALQDLGIFAAISVLGASCFALVFIPQVYKNVAQKTTKKTVIDKFSEFPLHKNKWVLGSLVLLLGVSWFTHNRVTFNNDLTKLNFQTQALLDAQKRLDVLTNLSSKSVYVAAYGNSEQEALKTNDSVFSRLQTLKKKDAIISFSSIGAIVHSEEKQQKQIDNWHQFFTPEIVENLKSNLVESGSDLGFKPTTFNAFYAHLNADFKTLKIQDYEALKIVSPDDFISSKNDFTTITTLVKVEDNNTNKIINDFKTQEHTLVIDRQQMNETFLGNLKNDFNQLVLYSLIVVLLLLFVFYRSFSLTLITIVPIAITWFLTIGMMGLLDIQFNIFNIIISTFIFGLGIDYSIFMTNGLLHEYRTGESSLPTHKTSIILSVITTILGVGVLIFAKHPALYSISLVSIIGIVSAMLVSFSIQPLLFNLFVGSKTKRPITLRLFVHSVISFGYFGLGGLILSILGVTFVKVIPLSKKTKMKWFHNILSKFKKSVLYTNPFVDKKIINLADETFEKQAVLIANHTSFLDILAIGMLHPKLIFLVNDWVYNSPIFGKAVRMAGFYPVSSGIESGVSHLQTKIDQGYSLIAFPEGTRSNTNKIKRFHKGAFYLAEQFQLDIVPVLIHGNSEVNPKGSFIIKDGSITLKILDRIKADDKRFGESYSQRAKQIGAYFRTEFEKSRNELEDDTYFHKVLLEDYRYKGDELYQTVKNDLKIHAKTYKKIIDVVGKRDCVLHLSLDAGQLDFLLALDSSNRKIMSYIDDNEQSAIVANSFITHRHGNIQILPTFEDSLTQNPDTIIVNLASFHPNDLKNSGNTDIDLLILLKDGKPLQSKVMEILNFEVDYEDEAMCILKSKKQR